MKVTRRDLLVWSAGAAAGLVVSPVPWKLLGDTSIWTQNWPWIPQPAHGPVEVKTSICTLCPNGCGVRVRTVAGWAVGVAGLRSHPVSQGALCPLGFAAHQLTWHPARLRTVRHRGATSSWDEARSAFAKAWAEGPIAIVDGQPGRAASSVFETAVEKRGGTYCVVLSPEAEALTSYSAWTGAPAESLGYDLENARTVVSFGAPLLDGWGAPGRFTRLWAERAQGTDPQLRLVQVEPAVSRTGARAWRRVAIRESSEAALAAGLARVLLEERLVQARGPMPPMTLAESAEKSGIGVEAIRDLARTIVARPPVLAIANDDNPAIAALNVILGAVGASGGIVQRSKRAKSHTSADTDLHSVRAVLIDATVPWDFIPRTNAEIFRFAAWDGRSNWSDWLLPAPGFLEDLTDVPTAPASATETYAIAPSLVTAPTEVQSAAQFLNSVEPTLLPVEKIIRARCEDLFRGRTGALAAQELTPLTKIESVEKLEQQLRNGAVWVGETQPGGSLRAELTEWPAATSSGTSSHMAPGWPLPILPPLASKLSQESGLRESLERRNV